jgi:hypothetical protein
MGMRSERWEEMRCWSYCSEPGQASLYDYEA